MSELADLLAVLEAPQGREPEINARLWCLAEGFRFSHVTELERAVICFPPDARGAHRESCVPDYMRSQETAIALAERLFPGVWWLIGKGRLKAEEPLYGAQLLFGTQVLASGDHEQEVAIAILIALLKALIVRGPVH